MTHRAVTTEAVEALLATGDVTGVITHFKDATDQERAATRHLASYDRRWRRDSADDTTPSACDVAVETLFAATGLAADVAVGMDSLTIAPGELLRPVIAAIEPRGERFHQALGRAMLASDDRWRTPWRLLRALERRGLIDPEAIDGDAYIRALAFGGVDLASDPELEERQIWRLFEVSGALTSLNVEWWAERFAALAERSVELRDRVLDGVFGALATDFAPGQLSACIHLAHVLEPTDAELADRVDAIGALCGAPSPVRSHALDWLERIGNLGAMPSESAVVALGPALVGREKKTALKALRLIDRFGQGEEGTSAIIAALGHPHPDVAERALKLLERRGDAAGTPKLRAEVLGYIDLVPESLRPRVARLAEVQDLVIAPSRPRPAQPAPALDPDPHAPWADDRQLPTVDDPDEIVALSAMLLEGQGDGDDFESLVAGLCTLAGADVDVRSLFEPLRKRAQHLRSPDRSTNSIWRSSRVAQTMAQVVSGIVGDRELKRPGGLPSTPLGLAAARLYEAGAAATRNEPVIPLAAPTHRGGQLVQESYRERVGRGGGIGDADALQAALRVGLVGRSPRLLVRPVALAKGTRPDGHTCPLDYTRSTAEPSDVPMVKRGLEFVTFMSSSWGARHATFDTRSWWPWDLAGTALDVAVATVVLASRPDLVAAAGALTYIHPSLDYEYRGDVHLPMLRFLGEPAVPMEGPALVLLTIGFTAPVGDRAAAVDAAIAAVDQRRLDPVTWGRLAAEFNVTRLLTLPRMAAAAVDLASAGPAHRVVAQQFLLAMVANLEDPPTTLYALLDAVTAIGFDGLHVTPEADGVLRLLAGRSSRAGKSARTILELTASPPSP